MRSWVPPVWGRSPIVESRSGSPGIALLACGGCGYTRMMAMRTKFHEQLDVLTDRLASMCHLAGQAIKAATDALVRADLPAAERVFDLNEQIEALRARARSRR
ncbi:phosphate transport system protein PhoU [Rhodococcus wratislaviensis IFP 2016]|nr:phosphate transport system protein PhoU [Rhodococcus wratislaviensis IFP 2016]CAG7634231.1 hypothetical protein E143388_07582 [Rhodococcus opacus]